MEDLHFVIFVGKHYQVSDNLYISFTFLMVMYNILLNINMLLTIRFTGVTSSGYSCGICKYKAHKACASNVVVTCKWTTLNTVDEKCLSRINVSSNLLKYLRFDIQMYYI